MTTMNYSLKKLKLTSDLLGTGFLPIRSDNWWFAIGKKDYWREFKGKLQISFTSIGGHLNDGESFLDATTREVIEETGSSVEFTSFKESYYVKAKINDRDMWKFEIISINSIKIIETPKPWLVYLAEFKSSKEKLGVTFFRGKLLSTPRALAEVPALIKIDPTLLIQCPMELEKLLEEGAQLSEQIEKAIPQNAILYPFGSAEIVKNLLLREKTGLNINSSNE